MTDLMTTEELAAVTGISPEQLLTLFDLGPSAAGLRGKRDSHGLDIHFEHYDFCGRDT
jgi:hypothetical protein